MYKSDISKYVKGFTLIEIAIALLIVGTVFVGLTSTMGSFHSASNVKESQNKVEDIKALLFNFAVSQKYLPCPDTDNDGYENRTTSGTVEVCNSVQGTVPYFDLGVSQDDVVDAWGNQIRYAVNTRANLNSDICDKTTAASYFCNQGAGRVAWFSYNDTPPLVGNIGLGNYTICNGNVATCSGTPTAANVFTNQAVAVLVAYNKDGANCATAAGASLENCNTNSYYHQLPRTDTDTQFFDDVIVSITGGEMKAKVLNPVVAWNSYDNTPTSSALTPTYEDFDISANDDLNKVASKKDDVVSVKRNVSAALDLDDGDDYIAIGNDLQAGANLNTGADNDTVYVVGQAYSAINLGEGDDKAVLAHDLLNDVFAEDGKDKVWVKGSALIHNYESSSTTKDTEYIGEYGTWSPNDIGITIVEEDPVYSGNTKTITRTMEADVRNGGEWYLYNGSYYAYHYYKRWITTEVTTVTTDTKTPELNMGAGEDVFWLGSADDPNSGKLEGPIYGGDDYDILVLENMTKSEWDADYAFQRNVNEFELVIFKDDGSGNREYIEVQ